MSKILSQIVFYISGVKHTVKTDDITPETTLNVYLRDISHLVGTKRMCLEGGCGTCIVAVEEYVNGKRNIFSVNSCLVSILSCHGWKIHTIEGIGGPLNGYHPAQNTLADNNGTQCGFCSPGMVMNMYALLESGRATVANIEDAFGGNLCRCTGYRPILAAFRKLAIKDEDKVCDIEDLKICKEHNKHCNMSCKKQLVPSGDNDYQIQYQRSKWMKVHNISDLLQILATSTTTNYQLVGGNTARGVYYLTNPPELYIDITAVNALIDYSLGDDTLILGGNISLNRTMSIFDNVAAQNENFSYLKTMMEHINLIASLPIRNIATLAGNLMIKHKHNEFPSDVFLLLETFKAVLVIVDDSENETLAPPSEFLLINMNRKVIKSIILRSIDNRKHKYISYKIMPRAQNSHAMVNAGFLFEHNEKFEVKSANIVFGGINARFIHASGAENILKGHMLFDNNLLGQAFESLDNELKPDHVLPNTTPEYRKSLAISLFYKFVLNICPKKYLSSNRLTSGGQLLDRPISSGIQQYGTNPKNYPLGQPIAKVEALAQTSGQAEYVADIPDYPNQLFGAFVTAKAIANSHIASIDASAALKVNGVVAFYSSKDIPGENTFMPKLMGSLPVQEELFCSGKVQYYDQPIGLVVAISHSVALRAADLVKVTFTAPITKPYLNTEDVINANAKSRIHHKTTVLPKKKGNDIKHVVKGNFYVKWQYHFHMEAQCCLTVPTEDGLDMFPSSQWMDLCQVAAAAALNLPTQKINVKVRRCGGGFGAKISRFSLISTASALAAYKLRRPVRIWMPFITNMNVLGKRYPLWVDYEAGVNEQGFIQYLDASLYTDIGVGGNEPVDDLIIPLFENCYDISTWTFSTYEVITDTHGNCFCRAPGTLEGMGAIESIMDHIAYNLNMDPVQVRLVNTNKPKFPQLWEYWKEMDTWADIPARKRAIEDFNKANRWRKKGMSLVPMSWLLEVVANYTVLVSIFHADGGVTVCHGGIEIGQGINTKVVQVCAYKFGISVDQVSVKPSLNIVAPNASTTGGSLTTEAICYALVQACDTLIARMKPIRDKMKDPKWPDLVKKCFNTNVNLSCSAFYSENEPGIREYQIYGLCATEVEVDILTGQRLISRVDIIEDVGESMSPLIDIGQVEGAFVMGIGYYTTEEIVFNEEGQLQSNRTWNYRVPGARDIPVDFRIKFPENNPNPVGVLKSKAVGEPPICLSISVPLAIRSAVASARHEADPTQSKWFKFEGTTSVESTFLNSLNSHKLYRL